MYVVLTIRKNEVYMVDPVSPKQTATAAINSKLHQKSAKHVHERCGVRACAKTLQRSASAERQEEFFCFVS